MNPPIKFPADEDVIREEAARFRALSPDEQVNRLGEMVRLYYRLADLSGRRSEIDRLAEEDEHAERRAVEEFAARFE
jgi:hypothetical protein